MEPAEPVFERHLGVSDAVLWDIEKDPVLRSTITVVALLDRQPDWARLLRRLEHGTGCSLGCVNRRRAAAPAGPTPVGR